MKIVISFIMKPELYILELNNGQYYIGCTENLPRRITEHRSGKTVSIKYKLPFELVFHEECDSNADARKAESFIKKQKSKIFTKKVIEGKISLGSILGGR